MQIELTEKQVKTLINTLEDTVFKLRLKVSKMPDSGFEDDIFVLDEILYLCKSKNS